MAKSDVHTQSFAAQKIKSKRLINDMINGTKYSRVDQVNFVEDNLSKIYLVYLVFDTLFQMTFIRALLHLQICYKEEIWPKSNKTR